MRTWLLLLPVLALGACSSLPNDGPASQSFGEGVRAPEKAGYAVVDLDYRVAEQVAANPPPVLAGLAANGSDSANDRIGEGDVLSVSIFEPTGGMTFSSDNGAGQSGGTQTENLPRQTVGADGAVMIPFAGRVHVAGLTVVDAADAIRHALRGKAIDPQVDVSVVGNAANTVTVVGEIRNVGHEPLSANNERLLDVIATAGGPTRPPADIAVTVVRGDVTATASLLVLLHDPAQNIRLAPRDQVRLLYAPRKYSTFGAFGHVSEQLIEDEKITLAEAISKNGGLDTMTANAGSVLLFRFERPEVAAALGVRLPPTSKGVPVVYRLNLLKPAGFFVASNFEVRPDDLIYVPRSDTTQLKKFLDVVLIISQTAYNLSTTPVVVH